MSGISDGERLFGTDTFERAKSICRLSIDVLDCLRYFRMYVINGIAAGGNMCDFHESPGCLREAIFQLWSHCHERDVPKGHDVWALLPQVELANADNLRRINCGEFFVLTATEAIFRKSSWLQDEARRACLWVKSGVTLGARDNPQWAGPGGRPPSISDLVLYRDVLLSIQKTLIQWKITKKNLRLLEHWIEVEQLRTKRYLLDSVNRVEPRTTKAAAVNQAVRQAIVRLPEDATPPGASAVVAAKTPREQNTAPMKPDGQFGPDGFCLDGILVTGLTDNELALLKLVLDKQPKGPTEDDVCELNEFKSWPRERIDKLLGTIKGKFLAEKSPRVLRWANRHLVFREPRPRANVTKPRGQTAGRKRGETLQKDGRHKRGG